MDAAFSFLASMNGRIARIVVGAILVVLGIIVGGVGGWILIIVGLLPVGAGVFDVCLFAPLFGHAFKGDDLRKELSGK
jgi:hypothetical protein